MFASGTAGCSETFVSVSATGSACGSECENIYLDNKDIILPTPTKQFYIFDGWYLDNGTFQNEYTLSKSITLLFFFVW